MADRRSCVVIALAGVWSAVVATGLRCLRIHGVGVAPDAVADRCSCLWVGFAGVWSAVVATGLRCLRIDGDADAALMTGHLRVATQENGQRMMRGRYYSKRL